MSYGSRVLGEAKCQGAHGLLGWLAVVISLTVPRLSAL
jgi:hypothetical protein